MSYLQHGLQLRRCFPRQFRRILDKPRPCRPGPPVISSWRLYSTTNHFENINVSNNPNYAPSTIEFVKNFHNNQLFPLGSLSEDDWMEALMWLSRRMPNEERNASFSGHQLRETTLLVKRLLEEQAVAGTRDDEWWRPVLAYLRHCWTEVTQQHTHSPMALKYAIEVLEWSIELSTVDETTVFEALAKVCAEQHSKDIIARTVDAEIRKEPYDSELLVARLLQCAHAVGGSDLVQHLGHIMGSTEKPTTESQDTRTPAQATQSQSSKLLSDFEAQSLLERIVQSIQKAGGNDQEKVIRLVENWQGYETNIQQDSSLFTALVEYYSRIGDIKSATTWLQRVQSTESVPAKIVLTSLSYIIRAHAQSKSPQACYRMEELLSQVQKVSTKDHPVNEDLYKETARKWLASQDRRRGDRAQSNILSMTFLDHEVMEMLVHAVKIAGSASEECVIRALTMAVNTCQQTDTDALLLEHVASIFAHSGAWEESLKLVEAMKDTNVVPSPSLCNKLVQSTRKNPEILPELARGMITAGAHLSLDTHEWIIDALLKDLRNEPKKQSQRTSLARKFIHQLLNEGDYNLLDSSDQSKVQKIISNSLEYVAAARREKDAYDWLCLAEKYVCSADSKQCYLPLSCFISVERALASRNSHDLIKNIYQRLLEYQRNGSEHLAPNAQFCQIYLSSISKSENSTLEDQMNVLETLVSFYKLRQDDAFKPIDRMYNGIFLILRKNPNSESVAIMERLVDEIFDLQIELKDGYALASAMEILIRSNTEPLYSRVMKIKKKLENSPESFHTWSLLISACARARKNERQGALLACLEAVRALREAEGRVSVATYRRIFRVLQHLEVKNEKIVIRLFELCCADGALSNEIATSSQQLLSSATWKQISNDGRIPNEWTSHIDI